MNDKDLRSLLADASGDLFDLKAELGDVIYKPNRCAVYRTPGSWVVKLVLRGASRRDEVDVQKTFTDEFLSACIETHGPDLAFQLLKTSMRKMFRSEIDRVMA